MKKIILFLIPVLTLLSCDYDGNHVHRDQSLLSTDHSHEGNLEENESEHYHPPYDFLYNHLDYNVEIFIEESGGLIRPGIYNLETGDPATVLKANEKMPFLDIRLKENITLVIRTIGQDEYNGIKFESNGLEINSVTVEPHENNVFVHKLFIEKVDKYVGHLIHVQGHICLPDDPDCSG